MSKDGMVSTDCVFVKETEMAILVETPSGDEIWLPKSQSEVDCDTVYCKEWLADKHGLT